MGSHEAGEVRRIKMLNLFKTSELAGQRAPTLTEITETLSLSKSTVHTHLRDLVNKGVLYSDSGGYYLPEPERRALAVQAFVDWTVSRVTHDGLPDSTLVWMRQAWLASRGMA